MGEYSDIVFLNGHIVKLPLLCLHPPMSATLKLGQTDFLLQWVVVNIEDKPMTIQHVENK